MNPYTPGGNSLHASRLPCRGIARLPLCPDSSVTGSSAKPDHHGLRNRRGPIRSACHRPRGRRLSRLAEAIIDGLGPADRMQIADLDGRSPPRPATWTSDRALLRQAVEPSNPRATQTFLWDRVLAAISVLSGEPGYRAIIVVSDGQDSMSRGRRDEVARAAQRGRGIVHAIELPLTIRPLVLNGRVMPITRSNDLRHVRS